MNMNDPQVGDPLPFIPSAFVRYAQEDSRMVKNVPIKLNGRVVYVNREHRYYVVQAQCNGAVLNEAFKF